jgi:hypothetical protein
LARRPAGLSWLGRPQPVSNEEILRMIRLVSVVACVLAACAAPSTARAGADLTASASAIIQEAGPRTGDPGKVYLNVEGKANGKYASFGVVDFDTAKSPAKGTKVKGAALTLTQSLPPFAKEGKVRVYVSSDTKTSLSEATSLKFVTSVAEGIGVQLKPLLAVGDGVFKKVKNGQAEKMALTLDDASRAYVEKQLAEGAAIRVVIVPADDQVAATYFGAACENPDQRPRLSIELAP